MSLAGNYVLYLVTDAFQKYIDPMYKSLSFYFMNTLDEFLTVYMYTSYLYTVAGSIRIWLLKLDSFRDILDTFQKHIDPMYLGFYFNL